MSDIFISYASADRARVKPLVEVLQREGWSVWWDRVIPPGKTWDEVIESAIRNAKCVLVLWSKASVASEWVRLEAHHGKQRRILIPAKIDDVEPPFAFQMIQAASLVDWRGERDHAELAELLREVESLVPRRAQTATQPPPVPPANPEPPPAPEPARIASKITTNRLARLWNQPWTERTTRLAAVVGMFIGLAVWQPWKPTVQQPVAQPETYRITTNGQTLPPAPAGVRTKINPKDGLEYAWIPPGQFQMGCSPGDNECGEDKKPGHPVTITRGFWMGRTEVTEAAYNRSVGKTGGSEQMPKVNVSWGDAKAYCEWAGLRLPTEAEWEYAARAGSPTGRYGALNDVGWYNGNSGEKLHAVAGKRPNAWGLYDMLGNAWEWVQDWYDRAYYKGSPSADPPGSQPGTYRTLRGSSWFDVPRYARASLRSGVAPSLRNYDIGFRCSGELR